MLETKWKMGDIINIPGQDEKFILARTNNFKEQTSTDKITMFHFQFIGTTTGNRYSNKVVTHYEPEISENLEEFEILYLVEEELTKEQIRECHIKGPDWNNYDPTK